MKNGLVQVHMPLLILLQLTLHCGGQDAISPSAKEQLDSRLQRLQHAKKQIKEHHDFSPIDQAHAEQDLWQLWQYYTHSFVLPMKRYEGERFRKPEELAALRDDLKSAYKLNHEIHDYAGSFLKRIPGHARLLGDYIEARLHSKGDFIMDLPSCFVCLRSLGEEGSTECIEQLGRFLFDKRDPGYVPLDPSQTKGGLYDFRGVENPIQNYAQSGLFLALKERVPFIRALESPDGNPTNKYAESLRTWWLTSDEAAPYRLSLASTGVVLPPGYPPMKELEGSPTTIAPPLKNPPYPDGYPLPRGVTPKP